MRAVQEAALCVRRFMPSDAGAWDDLVASSRNGTFLHSRRFLSYHGTRFEDRSMIVEDDAGTLLGVFPAAVQPDDPEVVVSHPGSTYGGLVHEGRLVGGRCIEALEKIVRAYGERGAREVRYKVVPYIYHSIPSADDLYALFRLGAVRYRCDLSATVDLERPVRHGSRRRRGRNMARRAGVTIERGARYLPDLWPVLEDNLRRKHGAAPVHTLEEILLLQERFPDAVHCTVGLLDGRVIAGGVTFRSPHVVHLQYSASSRRGYEVSAVDLVIEAIIEWSTELGVRYFDFGTNNEREGRYLNEGLYAFKTKFGAGGVPVEFYRLSTDLP